MSLLCKKSLTLFSLPTLALTLGLPALTGCGLEMDGEEDPQAFAAAGPPIDHLSARDLAQDDSDTVERIEHDLTRDEENFIKPLSYVAHYLGYAWVGGNGGQYVGEDMNVTRDGDTVVIQGNNSGGCEGHRCGDKTSITISNFNYTLDGNTFEQGPVTTEDLGQPIVLTGKIINLSSGPQTYVGTITSDETVSWSKTDTTDVSTSVAVTATVNFPADTGSLSATRTFAAGKSWASTEGGSESVTVSSQVRATVPARSWMPYTIELNKAKIAYPYAFKARLSYDVTMKGFLRWSGNAWNTHPKNRPTRSHTFTIGRATSDRSADIDYQWGNRDFDTRWWDWQWAIDEFGENNVRWAAANSIRPTMVDVKGVFSADAGFESNAIYGEDRPLDEFPGELPEDGAGIYDEDGNLISNETL